VQAADTRSRIHAAAVELFTSKGYEQTSLRELADRVSITKASLYYHYPSKQALLLGILEPFTADWRRTVAEAEQLPHNPANVRYALERTLSSMLGNRAACGMLVRDAAAVVAALAPMLEELVELSMRMQNWLAGPDPTPAERLRAVAAVETLTAAITATAVLPEMSDDEVRRVLLDAAAAVLGLPTGPQPGGPPASIPPINGEALDGEALAGPVVAVTAWAS
jgi:AcrR family transcriptional regulator